MSDRTLRTVVAGLSGLLVLVIAVTLLVIVSRSGPAATGSPSAPPVAIASPSADATVTPTESTPPSASTEPSPTTAETSPSAGPSGSPGATSLATMTFVGLKLDADQDAGGEQRTITFQSDGAGTVTAKLASTSPEGTTHMCFLVGTKEIGCEDWRSGTLTGKTSQAHATWKVTLLGSDFDTPTVNLTVTFQADAPSVTIQHARFDGTAAPEMNGINARFTARAPGEVRLVAEWGGHPLLYEINLYDDDDGAVNTTQGSQPTEPATNVDDRMPVTAGNWRIVLKNTEDGFGTTDMTATISWP